MRPSRSIASPSRSAARARALRVCRTRGPLAAERAASGCRRPPGSSPVERLGGMALPRAAASAWKVPGAQPSMWCATLRPVHSKAIPIRSLGLMGGRPAISWSERGSRGTSQALLPHAPALLLVRLRARRANGSCRPRACAPPSPDLYGNMSTSARRVAAQLRRAPWTRGFTHARTALPATTAN